MMKLKVYFKNDPEEVYETESLYLNKALAIEEFLEFEYNNSDGWEWMPKGCDKEIVIVETEDGTKTEFLYRIDYSPDFFVYKVDNNED